VNPSQSSGPAGGHSAWRRRLLLLLAAFFAAVFISPRGSVTAWTLVLIATCGIPLGSALLAWSTARRFEPGEAGRKLWSMIALIGVADAVVVACFVMPRVVSMIGASEAAIILTIASTGLVSLSRIGLAWALWIMVRLYRKSELAAPLRSWDYVLIAAVMALGVVSLVFAGSIARSTVNITRPDLIKWVSIAGLPHLAALAICSVLGITVWRYSEQMGGGLVAKAWRSILLYAVLWLARLGILGAFGSVFGMDTYHRPAWVSMFDFASILAAEYLFFLAVSYQYEACTAPVVVDEAALESIP
jgi:hypothetical protein